TADADYVRWLAVLRVLAFDEDASGRLPPAARIGDVSETVSLPPQRLELVALRGKGALKPFRDLLFPDHAALLRAHALQAPLHLAGERTATAIAARCIRHERSCYTRRGSGHKGQRRSRATRPGSRAATRLRLPGALLGCDCGRPRSRSLIGGGPAKLTHQRG